MGMDINGRSGVVFPVEEAAGMIFKKAKKSQIATAVAAVESNWRHDDKSGLDSVKDRASLASWLIDVSKRLISKDGEYIDSLALTDLLEILVESLDIPLPMFFFEYWAHQRLNGYEVPIRTPCVVFHDEKLFETKMTAEGKKLAALLGLKKIERVTWTSMSV